MIEIKQSGAWALTFFQKVLLPSLCVHWTPLCCLPRACSVQCRLHMSAGSLARHPSPSEHRITCPTRAHGNKMRLYRLPLAGHGCWKEGLLALAGHRVSKGRSSSGHTPSLVLP